MNKWMRWLFPALYGLLTYLFIRLITDVITGNKFWHRSASLNATEITFVIVISYPLIALLNYFLRRNAQKTQMPLTGRILWKEFGEVFLYASLYANATCLPFAALTDDGLQWFDVVNINVVTALFNLCYYAISRAIGSLKKSYEQQLQIEKITNDQLQTELRFLRAQYHPHFLFNALNTAYFQLEEDPAQARNTIEKLSELLRYQLYDPHQRVPVSRELDYLQSFIDLQRQRMNSHLQLEVSFDPLLGDQPIYPLLLLPLVENAFKYAGGAYWIRIRAELQEGALRFTVANAVPEGANRTISGIAAGGSAGTAIADPPSSGIGLENLRRRLELLYPRRHEYQSEQQQTHFTSTLIIPL